MCTEDTLRIKYLPNELSDAEKEDFMLHFGAQEVKILTNLKRKKTVVFAKFASKEVAASVLNRLHQVKVLKNRLCVEYADQEFGPCKLKVKNEKTNESQTGVDFFNNFITKINAFNNSVNYNQPPPAHLKYAYPKANRGTVSNIAHALATVPKFYTQVLHLMNKMNLPPPFVIEDSSQVPVRLPPVVSKTQHSTSESELESDEDSKTKKQEFMPQKRPASTQKTIVKRPKFIKPSVVSSNTSGKSVERPEDVFDKVNVNKHKKIEVKILSDTSLENPGIKSIPVSMNDYDKDEKEGPDLIENELQSDTKVISSEELLANQIPAKDLDVLPVFKNYHTGMPSSRLYVKNIAKTVSAKDLEYIFKRYKVENSSKNDDFGIRLMQEGRMKGQAFVTLHSVEVAQKALQETNGFILKNKPLVVMFAKPLPLKR